MPHTPFFVAPLLLLPRASPPAVHTSARRRAALTPRASASDGPPPPPPPGPPGEPPREPPNEADARYSRFSEFAAHGGDARLQEQLVSEVLWGATRAATTQSMESTIQGEMHAVSELLSELYSKSRRDLQKRNHELAMRASLPSISKWNQQLMRRHKASKLQRSQISKELAIVHALLRRTARSRSRSRSNRNARGAADAAAVPLLQQPQPQPQPQTKSVQLTLLRAPNALLLTLVLCATALESFENVVSQENGPSTLAHYSAFGALFVLCAAYLHALRSAHARALHQLRGRSSSPFVSARHRRKR